MWASKSFANNEVTCVVVYRPKDAQPDDIVSCSAISLSSTYILVPGSILSSPKDSATDMLGKFDVMCKLDSNSIECKKAKVVAVWKCRKLADVIKNLFSSSDIKPDSSEESDILINLLSMFILLELDLDKTDAATCVFPRLQQHSVMGELSVGAEIFTCSTPFGSSHINSFFNSWARGIVSKNIDNENVAFLSDVTCVPGGQGGIVYLKNSMVPAGIMIHPVIWRLKECTGLSIIGSLTEILQSLGDNDQNLICVLPKLLMLSSPIIMHPKTQFEACSRLVRVTNGQSWGSGILLNENYVLTCQHVVANHGRGTIYIDLLNKRRKVIVIYRSETECLLDVAILELKKPLSKLRQWPPTIAMAKIGMRVNAQGYGLFQYGHTSTISSGIVSNISYVGPYSYNIVTTCKVHSGSSGGVVTDTFGGLVAMITANTYDSANNISYTNVSFALSLHLLNPSIRKLCTHKNVSGFTDLEKSLKNNDAISVSSKL